MPKSIYIQGPGGAPYEVMFGSMGISRAKTIGEADYVCFTGGEDVDPALYGENALRNTCFNDLRDGFDSAAYARAKTVFKGETLKPCVGICRGSQFLNVMNGGKLWQDIDRHTSSHTLWDPHVQKEYFVSSTHHQQMIPHSSGILVAYAKEAHHKSSWGRGWDTVVHNAGLRADKQYKDGIKITKARDSIHPSIDAEVVWYPDTLDLCFQPHPEFHTAKECKAYFELVFNRYLNEPNLQKRVS
jgi:gamma-glutamyl-gamma-aminobutyrate hydrolase PuuD